MVTLFIQDTIATFEAEVFEEHLDEAAFLIEQIETLRFSLPWLQLGELEDRLQNHLNALALGGEAALKTGMDSALQQLDYADLSSLAVVLALSARQDRWDVAKHLLQALTPNQLSDHYQFLSHAFCFQAPPSWDNQLLQLAQSQAAMYALVVNFLAWRAPQKQQPPRRSSVDTKQIVALAGYYRLQRDQDGVAHLRDLLQQNTTPPACREQLVLALTHLGDRHWLTTFQQQDWLLIPFVLAAEPAQVIALAESLSQKAKPSPVVYSALGLAGAAQVVPQLIDRLEASQQAGGQGGSIAAALHLITGAALWEEVFIAEEPDPLELQAEERQRLAEGETVLEPSGQPSGAWTNRISQEPQSWRAWWRRHQNNFQVGQRYRFGEAISQTTLHQQLCAPEHNNQARAWLYHEYTFRYQWMKQCDVYLPVNQQQQCLHASEVSAPNQTDLR